MRVLRRADERWAKYEKRIRDSVIFLVGIGGVINELWVEPSPRAAALVFLASLIGVPFVLSADEKRSVQRAPEQG